MYGRLSQWLHFIEEYKFEVCHFSGGTNIGADYPSWNRSTDDHKEEEEDTNIEKFLNNEAFS